MQFKPILCLFILLTLAAACTHKDEYKVSPAIEGPFTVYQNIAYGPDSPQQSMDVYLPPVRDTLNTAVVILLHGGGWVQGDKTDFVGSGVDTFFTANGCAVVNMNYRLDGTYKYPAPIDDIGLVMDFIKQKCETWKINPNRVCLLGKSSGSQLALLYAYSRNQDKRIKAVIDAYGPTNLVDTSVSAASLAPLVASWLGPFTGNSRVWYEASPIFYISQAVPTVIVQGTADMIVHPIQSEMLQDSLLVRGTPFLYIPWVGDGHGWDQVKWLDSRADIMTWLKNYL